MADNTLIAVGNLNEDLRTFPIAAFIPIPANGAYTLLSRSPESFQIRDLNIKLASGTASAQLRIDNVPIAWTGPVTTLSVTSSAINTMAAADFQVGINAKVELVLSSVSSPVALEMTAECRRT